MHTKAVKHKSRRAGVAYLFALLLLALMATLAVAMTSGVNLILQRPENSQVSMSSRLAAESGIAYLRYHISQPMISPDTSGGSLMQQIYDHLASELDASPSATGGSVGFDTGSNVVTVPGVQVDSDRWFSASVSMVSDRVVRLVVTGHKSYRSMDITRTCSIDLEPFGRVGTIFKNGIVTNGRFVLKGNGEISGLHNNSEADILCAGTEIDPYIIDISGNCRVLGELKVHDPDQEIKIRGNIQVGESYYHSQVITQEDIANNPEEYPSMVIGTEPVTFPTMDPSVYEPFATNIVDSSTDLSGIYDMYNIRIKANTNPHFSGDYSIYGVIYIEQPNSVHFSGNINICGVIVTEDSTPSDANHIDFTGNQTLNGVDYLPDTSEFASLRQLPGTFMLAPGFDVRFSGNVNNVGGTMAADKFRFCGNVNMQVKGTILSYGTEDFNLQGNTNVVFDHEDAPDIPAGFLVPGQFGEVADSYREY